MGVPPWVGLVGFLEQTPPFVLHLANRVGYEDAFWLRAKINSACSFLGKEGVCWVRSGQGTWYWVVTRDQNSENMQKKRRGHCVKCQDSGTFPQEPCPVYFALESGWPGFEFLSLSSKLGATLCPQQDSELYMMPTPP